MYCTIKGASKLNDRGSLNLQPVLITSIGIDFDIGNQLHLFFL